MTGDPRALTGPDGVDDAPEDLDGGAPGDGAPADGTPADGTTGAEQQTPPTPGTGGRAPLSEAERASAFATGRVPVDREAALRAGSAPVPRRFAFWVLIGFAVLGIGGVIAEHLVGNAGVGAAANTPVPTLAGLGPAGSTSQSPTGPTVPASPSMVIGLTHMSARPAPPIDLHSQTGAPWSLASVRGKTVVLTFLNAECNDICPVLGQEIVEADQILGAHRNDVQFVVVNSDPLETSLSVVPPALTRTGLDQLSNVTFLTGSLSELSSVWRDYGITVAVSNTNRLVSHSNFVYFIAPNGRLTLHATPFGNESAQASYSLDPSTIHTFAVGMAAAATSLSGAST